jgi:predicted metal-dependent hydrolase
MEWILPMIMVLIIFVSIYWMGSKKDQNLEILRPFLNRIVLDCGFDKTGFELYKSKKGTFTINKEKIYVETIKTNGQSYNSDTLFYVVLHEIAHILCDEVHHSERFRQLERKLHQKAIEYGWLKMSNVDRSYPCVR